MGLDQPQRRRIGNFIISLFFPYQTHSWRRYCFSIANKERAMAKRSNSKTSSSRSGTSRAAGRAGETRRPAAREDTSAVRPKKNALHEPSRPGREVGGKRDFGIPASRARGPTKSGGRGKDRERATGPTRSGTDSRETGVGAPTGSAGAGSGGDLDPDIVGLDGRALARAPIDRTSGPDMIEQGGSAPFASGPPAKGEDAAPRGKVGGSRRVTGGDTIDHGGGDVTTSSQGQDEM
jgi:hypothetical protein